MNYLFDYHVHSTHSMDGHNTIFEMCKSAERNGLKEIAMTDHFEITPNDDIYKSFDALSYLVDVLKVSEQLKGRIKVKLGIELGQPHLKPEAALNLIKTMPFDYVLGSVHKFVNGTDFSELDYSKYSIEEACEAYISQLKQLIEFGNFDCVGHIDLVKRYSTNYYQKRVSLKSQEELLKQILKSIIAKGKGIEINTSGLRQSPKETMPGIDVLKLYHDLGGEILTIGSDSHFSADVGKGIDIAIENAIDAGFKYLTVFDKRKPRFIKISTENNFYCFDKKAM